MTTIENVAPAAPSPSWVGQATAVEQSRAVAQVHAAVLVAQQYPRNQTAAIAAMRESCAQVELANRAFFSYRRGGSNVAGPSVYLARELARVWGNIDYGVQELLRDDQHGQSEMQAVAWDLQTNTRVSAVFIVPHMRDKEGGMVPLTQARDIYENNANQGAKRVRQAIFSVLPPWFVADAENRCRATIEHGGGVPLPQRIADVIADYEQYFQVDLDRLVQQLGKPSDRWTAIDVSQLRITGASLKNGELSAEEAFPVLRVTVAEVTGGNTPAPAQPKLAPATAPADEVPQVQPTEPARAAFERPAPAAEGEPPVSRTQRDQLHGLLDTCGVSTRKDKLEVLGKLVGHRLVTADDLTHTQADSVIALLMGLKDSDEPGRALDQVLAELDQVLAEIQSADQTGGA